MALAKSTPECASSSSHQRRPRLSDINRELTCILCNGYFVNATTISECGHSFCKSCIVQYLIANKCCPICEKEVHPTKPLDGIRSDMILQDIVYKLIPDVFKNEMKRRRDFYGKHGEAVPQSPEDSGQLVDHHMFYMANDKISLSLEYGYGDNQVADNGIAVPPTMPSDGLESDTMKRYLLCPAGLSVLHLKKFIARKYGLPTTYKVDVMYLDKILNEDYTLMDVAYIYAWKRSDPMRLFYRISERPIKRLKTSHPQTVETNSGSGVGVSNANRIDTTNANNKANSGVVSQSKLVQTSTSSCTSRTTASTPIMTVTGAASVPTFTGNNSQPTGVTPVRPSTATPRRTDRSKSASTQSQAVNTQPTPPGKSKAKTAHLSASAVQTDEPPKKLRKILPNNSSESTPKPVNTADSSTAPKTSSSTVTSLRQCRITLDKNKLCPTISLSQLESVATVANAKSDITTKSDTNASKSANTEAVKKSSNRKCSAFDVRTLIGTKSPTNADVSVSESFKCNQTPAKDKQSLAESKSKSGSQTQSKQSKASREVNRMKVTSNQCSMPSTSPSMTTSSHNKKGSNPPSVAIPRPPTNRSTTPNDRVRTPDGSLASLASLPSKTNKSATNVSQKGLNASAKSSKTSPNEGSVKSCNANRDLISDKTNSKISIKGLSVAKSEPPTPSQSTPLSPTSIRIKLPPPPQHTADTNKSSSKSANNKTINQLSPPIVPPKISQIDTTTGDKHNRTKSSSTSPTGQVKLVTTGGNGWLSVSKSGNNGGQASGGNRQGRRADINQIVSKIASGVTAKSASVNVTSTTPTLELSQTNSSSSAVQLSSGSGSGSNEVTPNDVNDNKVSTTTLDNNSSSIHKSESSAKSVSSASNSGNLVIRISTKTHSVESLVSPKDREKKFEIKRDSNKCSEDAIDSNKVHSQEEKKCKTDNTIKTSGDNEEEDDDIDGKLVVDVPNDDNSCESDVNSSKDMSDGGGQRVETKAHAVESSARRAHSTPEPVKANKMSDMSTKLAINISTAHQLSASSAVLASPPPTPTPSPKSESDHNASPDSKTGLSSSSNCPLDLSMSAKKERGGEVVSPRAPPAPIRAIYDIPPPKPKHCVNPAVLDKQRHIFPASAPKQHPSFKIMGSQSQGVRQNTSPCLQQTHSPGGHALETVKKSRTIGSPVVSSNTTAGSNPANSSRHRSVSASHNSHHQNHNHNHSNHTNHNHHNSHNKTYSVITPDPHRYTPKLVIRNIGSPPSITSHFNYPTHH